MAGDWVETTWAEIAELKYGKANTAYTDQPNIARVYGTNGPIGWHDTALQPGPGVIVGRKGAYRGVHYANHPFWVIDTAYYLKPLVPMDLRWAYYWLLNYDVNNIDDGSPIPSTTREAFGFTSVNFPPVDDQTKIADILASIDAKIDLNCQLMATLESMAQALFKSWFIDFDVVRAKVESRDIGISAEIAALFPSSFDDEGLPTGWIMTAPTNFFEIVGGGTPNTRNADYWNGKIPWYSIADAPKSGAYVVETEKSITPDGLAGSSTRIVEAGTTIISARGTVGKLTIAGRDMTFNQSCYGLCPKDGFGHFFVYLTACHVVARLKSISHGGVFSTITMDTFDNILFPIPNYDSSIIKSFEELVKPSFDQMLRVAEENLVLRALRDALLPKLLSGALRVKDAETATAAA